MIRKNIGQYKLEKTYTILGIRLRFIGYDDNFLFFKRIGKDDIEREEIYLDRKKFRV